VKTTSNTPHQTDLNMLKRISFLGLFLAGFLALACTDFFTSEPLDTPVEVFTSDNDGPYIFYRKNKIYVKSVVSKDSLVTAKIDSFENRAKEDLVIECTFKQNPEWNFKTKLHAKNKVESSEYSKAEKILAVSDIEGNFQTLRNFLISHKAMDEQYTWTFGKGHLVCLGDFFDRGRYVTECLWLIYHLEDQAKAAGGYVHFILGNHEIMNMSNDFRYVHGKYVKNAELIHEPIANWYKASTELGRWLATKNVIEKVDDILFVHGGIDDKVNRMDLGILDINNKCRPFYFISEDVFRLDDADLQFLYDANGPFWFRSYVTMTTPESVVDATLKKFNVKHIMVGHTIVDKVKGFYSKKVIAIDTRHTASNSQAFLMENKVFYRIDQFGKREEL
jgi:Calcineurin-like phosphoesterase